MVDPQNHNIATRLERQAAERPRQKAVLFPERRDRFGNMAWTSLDFAGLNRLCDEYARGLVRQGVVAGDRVSLLVKPCLEFIPLVFAVFKVGALPVLIDPGMGREGFLACLRRIAPRVLIGEPLAQALRLVFRRDFASVQISITNGTHTGIWGGVTIDQLRVRGEAPFSAVPRQKDDEAAILFTSGSTGPAKGVTYTHGIFQGQTRAIQEMYGIEPGEVDLACFPLFGLFSVAMGMTVVIPELDPTRPAQADPQKLIEAIETHGCTSAFGSPAIWRALAREGVAKGVKLPTLRRILMAGAPIPVPIHEAFQQIFDGKAQVHTPYGATESLPVASIGSWEVLRETAARTREGAGICVGSLAPGAKVHIIRVTDDPLPEWSDALLVPDGEVGELVIEGDVVTQEYKDEPGHNAASKIRKDGRMVHRIGDVGYRDPQGRLWFCGRKSHIVRTRDGKTLYPDPLEALFLEHPDVHRAALVGVAGEPVLIFELAAACARPADAVLAELRPKAQAHPQLSGVSRMLVHPAFPVDVRHNAKIDRPALAAWAAKQGALSPR